MIGINRNNGRPICNNEHLSQSIIDILFTRLGTRVMLRNYGSRLVDFLDAPINSETLIDVYQATAEAFDLWEPRINLARVQLVDADVAGKIELDLTDIDGNSILIPSDLKVAK